MKFSEKFCSIYFVRFFFFCWRCIVLCICEAHFTGAQQCSQCAESESIECFIILTAANRGSDRRIHNPDQPNLSLFQLLASSRKQIQVVLTIFFFILGNHTNPYTILTL